MPKIQNILNNLIRINERTMEVALRDWMKFTQKQIEQDLTSKYSKSAASITSKLTDWKLIEEQGVKTIKPAAVSIMQSGGNAAYKQLAIAGSFDVVNIEAVKTVNKFCSKLVTSVTAKTKKGINLYIKHGIKEGYSMAKIARDLRQSGIVGLTGNQTQSIINYRNLLQVKRPDLNALQVDKATLKYTNKTHRRRMKTIARTETANAQNIGYCQGLEQVGVEEAELRNGTNPCDDCIALNRNRYPIAEAGDIITVHPNCTCAMLPVINNKVIAQRLKKPPLGLVKKEMGV